uniref:Uncharacterized protein n=1 Tax=Sphaerodactylus townsendi TaxID=933632 RepID=A0ACB8GAT5_9SAUR
MGVVSVVTATGEGLGAMMGPTTEVGIHAGPRSKGDGVIQVLSVVDLVGSHGPAMLSKALQQVMISNANSANWGLP